MLERWGLVLAGGRSSRMGRDKASLLFRGEPLLERMAGLLRDAGATRVFISGPTGVPDIVAGLGPIAGLHATASKIPDGSSVLAVPVDMPLLDPGALRSLYHAVESGLPAAFFEGHPLPAAFMSGPEFREALETLLQEPAPSRRSVRALLERLAGRSLAAPADAGLENANSPAEWAVLADA